MLAQVLTAVSLAFSLPVLAYTYYTLILFFSSLLYPRPFIAEDGQPTDYPHVSILIATYNEKFVIGRTLDALRRLNYPHDKLHVIVADDSTDETREIIQRNVEELNLLGISAVVSWRENRSGYKGGALNHAVGLLKGDYVLLLDADSLVPTDALVRGLTAFERREALAFVSYRVGHYNRNQNLVTRLYALTIDAGDALTKMGSYRLDTPFSFQGGFTLVSTAAIKDAGYWSNDTIVEDADLSCRLFALGLKGIYLSDVSIVGEDPPSLEVWKKQMSRVAQGWAGCVRRLWRTIITAPRLSSGRKIALLLTLISPFSSLSWIVVTFISALAIVLGIGTPADSIFANPIYIALVSIPLLAVFGGAIIALRAQKILTAGNLILIPLISYGTYSMLTAISIGFLSGVSGKKGSFFRTPKAGDESTPGENGYFRALKPDRTTITEGALAIFAILLALLVALRGTWFLALALAGFGALTLRSMSLSRLFSKNRSDQSVGK
jgi:cellulose synthase/poly-beta-1,6-N-acetylglucosamine synthase-like glycosyltransferase